MRSAGRDGADTVRMRHLVRSGSLQDSAPMDIDEERKRAKQHYHKKAQKQYRCVNGTHALCPLATHLMSLGLPCRLVLRGTLQ